jgi:hypothetical protein
VTDPTCQVVKQEGNQYSQVDAKRNNLFGTIDQLEFVVRRRMAGIQVFKIGGCAPFIDVSQVDTPRLRICSFVFFCPVAGDPLDEWTNEEADHVVQNANASQPSFTLRLLVVIDRCYSESTGSSQ